MKPSHSGRRSETRLLESPVTGISLPPNFGNLSAFFEANAFVGVSCEDSSVRPSNPDRVELPENDVASIFEQTQRRQMNETSWYRLPESAKRRLRHGLQGSSRID